MFCVNISTQLDMALSLASVCTLFVTFHETVRNSSCFSLSTRTLCRLYKKLCSSIYTWAVCTFAVHLRRLLEDAKRFWSAVPMLVVVFSCHLQKPLLLHQNL